MASSWNSKRYRGLSKVFTHREDLTHEIYTIGHSEDMSYGQYVETFLLHVGYLKNQKNSTALKFKITGIN